MPCNIIPSLSQVFRSVFYSAALGNTVYFNNNINDGSYHSKSRTYVIYLNPHDNILLVVFHN